MEEPGCLETEAWQDELETRGLQHIPVSVVSTAFSSQRQRSSFNIKLHLFSLLEVLQSSECQSAELGYVCDILQYNICTSQSPLVQVKYGR